MRQGLSSIVFGLVFASFAVAQAPVTDVFLEWPPKRPSDIGVGEAVPLIERSALFGNPDMTRPEISPDGTKLAWLAPVNDVLNVWVAPIGDIKSGKPVTSDTRRGIRVYFWAHTNDRIVYLQDKDGDENWRVYSTDVKTAQTTDLTPIDGVAAQILRTSHKRPGEIVVGLNSRDPRYHDAWVIDLATGERTLLAENPGEVERGRISELMVDDDFRVRLAMRNNSDDGSVSILKPTDEGGWKEFQTIPREDSLSTRVVDIGDDGKSLIVIDSRKRNTAAVNRFDLATGELVAIHAWDDRCDAADVLLHPETRRFQAALFNYDRWWWKCVDGVAEMDFQRLEALGSGQPRVVSRSFDDRHWIVALIRDDGPTAYVHLDREKKEPKFLFYDRRKLGKKPLAPMHPVTIRSRDSMNLVSYLTLPLNTQEKGVARPNSPLPMVLLVHGGPWARDSWGYNPLHQLLANRGYAVLSVNFRGSTGFGKGFVNAGDREWARAMHDDLLDAVEWAVAEKIADPKKVAIMGGSYGGYATLVGLTFTPEVFACGVDIVGPSNLITLLNSIPPYWAPIMKMFQDRVGDPTTEEGKRLLWERSPLAKVDRICRPLLIAQGANDPRVKQSESDQIVKAMQEKNIPVTYVLFPDEGHGFRRPPNSLAFYAIAEQFLAQQLGGRSEPIGSDFEGSTVSVPFGAEQIPGLSEALRR